MKRYFFLVFTLLVTLFVACGENTPSEEPEATPTNTFTISGVSASYLSVKVNILSSNISKLAYIVEEKGTASHEEYKAEDLFKNGTVANCSTTGRTSLNLTGLSTDTEYDFYVVGQQADGVYTAVLYKEFKTKLVEKFAVMNKTYSSVSAYFVYPENLASTSVIKYATPDVVMYNYYGGDEKQDQWFNVEKGNNILTKSSEVEVILAEGQTITPGQPIYFMFGEYTKSGNDYTPNFGAANQDGYLYKELVLSEKPIPMYGKPEVEIVVRPSGKGSITITPSSYTKSFHYMIISEDEYNNIVKLMNNNANYMQWFVSSSTAESLFGSKKANSKVVIDASTLGLKQSTKYYFLLTAWGDEQGSTQAYIKQEFKLPPVAPTKANNIIVAHRGGSAEAGKTTTPDNSIASLRYAKSLKCYAAETDIYWTKDNRIIVVHATSDIKINGKYPWEHTLEELRKGYKLSNGETPPTLEEYITELMTEGSCTKLWLDLKNCYVSSSKPGYDYVGNACKYASQIIKEMEAEQWVEFICTGYEGALKKAIPYAKEAGISIGAMGNHSASKVKGYGYSWANFDITNIKSGDEKSKIQSYMDEGMELSIFTLDSAEAMATYLPYKDKLKGITTNYPKKYMDQWLVSK